MPLTYFPFSLLYRFIFNELKISQVDCLTVFMILLYPQAKVIFPLTRGQEFVFRILWSHWPPTLLLLHSQTTKLRNFSEAPRALTPLLTHTSSLAIAALLKIGL